MDLKTAVLLVFVQNGFIVTVSAYRSHSLMAEIAEKRKTGIVNCRVFLRSSAPGRRIYCYDGFIRSCDVK